MPDPDLTHLPHESWCALGTTHAVCCPGKAVHGCSCLTGVVVRALDDRRGAVVEAARALVEGWGGPPRVERDDRWCSPRLDQRLNTLAAAVRALDGEPR